MMCQWKSTWVFSLTKQMWRPSALWMGLGLIMIWPSVTYVSSTATVVQWLLLDWWSNWLQGNFLVMMDSIYCWQVSGQYYQYWAKGDVWNLRTMKGFLILTQAYILLPLIMKTWFLHIFVSSESEQQIYIPTSSIIPLAANCFFFESISLFVIPKVGLTKKKG